MTHEHSQANVTPKERQVTSRRLIRRELQRRLENPNEPHIQWYRRFISDVNNAIETGETFAIEINKNLTYKQLGKLVSIIGKLPEHEVVQKIAKWERKYPGEGRTRFIGLAILQLPDSDASKQRLHLLGSSLINSIRIFTGTPDPYYNELNKPKPEDLLNAQALREALENINLSVEKEGTVANQLVDPIGLSAKGMVVKTRTKNNDEEIEHGFTIPGQLLQILYKLTNKYSGEIFEKFVVEYCRDNEKRAEEALTFLTVLVNFISFLDSDTFLELFKPPKVEGREGEFLVHPFFAIDKALRNIGHGLYSEYHDTPLREKFRELLSILGLRYGEVYSDAHRVTLFTAQEEALIPKPTDFAKLAAIIARGRTDYKHTALGLIKLAESMGIKDINPLIILLNNQPQLQEYLISEAQRYGLLYDPEATKKALKELEDHPWSDVAEINDISKLINKGVTNIGFYYITGTYGPATKGHMDLFLTAQDYVNSLPEKVGDKVYQNFIVIVPVTNISGIPNYQKTVAQAGTIEIRLKVMLLQMSSLAFNREKILITTLYQPDTTIHQTTEDRVKSTSRGIAYKIWDDLRSANRSEAVFDPEDKFIIGPDELIWVDEEGNKKLAPRDQQRKKATMPGGVVVIRRKYLLRVMKEFDAIRTQTEIDTVIFTPGTPFSSSTKIRNEIHKTGNTQGVMAAARPLVLYYYNPKAEASREPTDLTVIDFDPEVHHAPSVRIVCSKLSSDPAIARTSDNI